MLYIHLFGHLRLFDDNQPLEFSARPKVLPLWAYLLLNRAKPVPRDALAYLLWPDVLEDVARTNLRRHLYELRRRLPPDSKDAPWLVGQSDVVQWNVEADYWLDVAEFERLSESPPHLAKAVALYTNDLLPQVYEDWITFERERLRNMYFANLSKLIAQSRTKQDHHQAIAYAHDILSHDPLREDTARELMSLCYLVGDRAGALNTYQQFERHLQEELGVPPMPETQALHQAILQNEPLSSVAPQTVAARTAPPDCPHNVPAPLNEFVGRAIDVAAVQNQLRSGYSRTRLLTLTGPAGAGKTRLALEVAACLLPDQVSSFPDGIFVVDLSAIREPDLVLSAIAETMDVKPRHGKPLLEELVSDLRPKHLLLCLDNMEQVLGAGSLIAELLAAAPNLRVLVTSREALRVYGEHEYPVLPLHLPDLDDLPPVEVLADNAAVSLFVARASERKPDFALTEDNAASVAEVCVHLDGLPLAIELAASRVNMLSPAAMLPRMTSRLAFLSAGARDKPERHQTLRGAIDWSYDLLDENEQQLFSSLGVFAGSCALPAIEAVCAPSCQGDVFDGLTSLLDKNLIQRVEDDDEPRYGLLAMLREYALEQLAQAGTLAAARQHHADYYAELAEQARLALFGPQQATWMAQLSAESDNLRAALTWLLDEAADTARVRTGAKLLRGIYRFMDASGRIDEMRTWCARALARRSCLSLAMQVRMLSNAGWCAQIQGDYEAANAFYEDGLALARRTQSPELISLMLHSLGAAAGRQGDYHRAEATMSEAVAVEREVTGGEMTPQLAVLLNNLSIAVRHLGDYERSAALLQESLDFKRAQGDQLGIASSLANLAKLALLRQDYAEAESSFRESLELRQTVGNRIGMLYSLSGLAESAMLHGDAVRSARLYSACEALHQEFGVPITPEDRKRHDDHVAALCQQLGQAHFEATWAMGKSMTMDQAVAYALQPSPADN
jgi:predicted ATPase/DNA-binding SARP family transcriptional activator/catechol 2,3-dioxygenase-like lactoylglutathione lyase family enzyme